jgi:hypothetical protein
MSGVCVAATGALIVKTALSTARLSLFRLVPRHIMSELKKKFRADPQIEKGGTATPVNCIFNEERPEITPARYCGGAAPGFAAALDGPANGASGTAVIFESTGLSPSTDWTLASCGLDPVICEPIVRTACGASA